MTEARTPCINPRCRRTYKSGGGGEVICGKCFRALPAQVRSDHRRYWREYRKWDRRILRTGDVLKAQRMHDVRDRFGRMIDQHWDETVRPFFFAPEKPTGIEAFLEEAGLA